MSKVKINQNQITIDLGTPKSTYKISEINILIRTKQ